MADGLLHVEVEANLVGDDVTEVGIAHRSAHMEGEMLHSRTERDDWNLVLDGRLGRWWRDGSSNGGQEIGILGPPRLELPGADVLENQIALGLDRDRDDDPFADLRRAWRLEVDGVGLRVDVADLRRHRS